MKKLIKLFIVMVVLCTTACTQIFDNRNDIDQMKNVILPAEEEEESGKICGIIMPIMIS